VRQRHAKDRGEVVKESVPQLGQARDKVGEALGPIFSLFKKGGFCLNNEVRNPNAFE